MQIEFTATKEVRAAIDGIGRTEDAQFSESGLRLALAGAARNRLLILQVGFAPNAKKPTVALNGSFEIESEALAYPHGLHWLDERTLVVANRSGDVSIFETPVDWPASSSVRLQPVRSLGADCLVRTPGSLSLSHVGLGLIELLVCNNYVNNVTRHLLDQRNGYAAIANEIVLDEGLDVPDGVAHSTSGAWIAVSNHLHHCVFVYRNDAELNYTSPPQGVLTGASFPHGLRFADGGRTLLVADAGAPFIHVYRSDDGDWGGERRPSDSVRVLDDEVFRRGHYNQAEGGPKGIGLTGDGRLLVTSCEEQPLGFWDARAFGVRPARRKAAEGTADDVEHTRDALLKYLSSAERKVRRTTEAIRRSRDWELQMVVNGRPSHIPDPLQRIGATLRNQPETQFSSLAGSARRSWHAGSYQEEVTEQGRRIRLRSYAGATPDYPGPHVALEAELPEAQSHWEDLLPASVAIARGIAGLVSDGEMLARAAAEVEAHPGRQNPWNAWIQAFARASRARRVLGKWQMLPERRMLLRLACPYQRAATHWAVMGLHLLWLARESGRSEAHEIETAGWEGRLAGMKAGLPDARLIALHDALTARQLPWTWDADGGTRVGYGSRQRMVLEVPPDPERLADRLAEMQPVVPIYTAAGTSGGLFAARRLGQLLRTSGLRLCQADSQMVLVAGREIGRDDSIGRSPAAALLRMPEIDAAVVEIVGNGLIRSGFPFERTDVAILLNVSGAPGGDMANAKAMADVLALTISPARLAVLNLEDEQCRRLGEEREPASVVWFSSSAPSERLKPLSRTCAGAVGLSHTTDGSVGSVEIWRDGENAGSLTLDGLAPAHREVSEPLLAAVAAAWFGPVQVHWDGLLQKMLAPYYKPTGEGRHASADDEGEPAGEGVKGTERAS
ncbi:MAG: hypothetical protein ACM3YM_04755 [Sphingomonadales bacterium]